MQNETQNQDTNTQVTQEESPAQYETPQNQDIGAQNHSTFEAAPEPGVPSTEGQETVDQVLPLDTDSEPSDIDPAVTMSSDDLVGSDRNVTMYPEDLLGPETAEEPGFDEDISDFWDAPGNPENPSDYLPRGGIDWNPNWWDVEPSSPLGSEEPSNPLPTESEDYDNDRGWGSDEDATPGGYDGSGIAGGLDLDQNGVFDQIENNPDMYPDIMSDGQEGYTYDEDAYEDAEDALKDLRHALQHGDEEDRAEALEKLQDYLGGFDKGNEDQENDSHSHGDRDDEQDENGSPENTGINPYPYMSDDEDGYTYDEDAYEDAEDALEDLQDALKDGDEEDRSEAIEELQGYLNRFDKGAEDEDLDLTGGDPEEVPNTVDKEPVDAPHASGAAVSGAAVGGAAVGAGAVGEAGGLGETAQDIDEALGIDGAGDVLGDLANGDFDGALDAATEQAGGAIDDALGIEGSGEVLENVANGDFDEALDTVTDSAGDYVGEWLDNEELGDTAGEVFDHIVHGDFEEALDTAVDGVGEALEDAFEDAGDKIGDFFGF